MTLDVPHRTTKVSWSIKNCDNLLFSIEEELESGKTNFHYFDALQSSFSKNPNTKSLKFNVHNFKTKENENKKVTGDLLFSFAQTSAMELQYDLTDAKNLNSDIFLFQNSKSLIFEIGKQEEQEDDLRLSLFDKEGNAIIQNRKIVDQLEIDLTKFIDDTIPSFFYLNSSSSFKKDSKLFILIESKEVSPINQYLAWIIPGAIIGGVVVVLFFLMNFIFCLYLNKRKFSESQTEKDTNLYIRPNRNKYHSLNSDGNDLQIVKGERENTIEQNYIKKIENELKKTKEAKNKVMVDFLNMQKRMKMIQKELEKEINTKSNENPNRNDKKEIEIQVNSPQKVAVQKKEKIFERKGRKENTKKEVIFKKPKTNSTQISDEEEVDEDDLYTEQVFLVDEIFTDHVKRTTEEQPKEEKERSMHLEKELRIKNLEVTTTLNKLNKKKKKLKRLQKKLKEIKASNTQLSILNKQKDVQIEKLNQQILNFGEENSKLKRKSYEMSEKISKNKEDWKEFLMEVSKIENENQQLKKENELMKRIIDEDEEEEE